MAASADSPKTAKATGGGYITYSSLFEIKDTSWTKFIWFRWEGAAGSTACCVLGTNTANTSLFIFYSDNTLRVLLDGAYRITTGGPVVANVWTCVAITFDGGSGSGTPKLYFGDVDTTIALDVTASSLDLTTAGTSYVVGAFNSTDWHFNGQLSNYHLYDRALSLEELQELQFNPGSIKGNLVVYAPINDSTDFGINLVDGTSGTVGGTLNSSAFGPPVHFPSGAMTV